MLYIELRIQRQAPHPALQVPSPLGPYLQMDWHFLHWCTVSHGSIPIAALLLW